MISLTLNGTPLQAPEGTSLSDLLLRLRTTDSGLLPAGETWDGFAVAVDYEVVPRRQWAEFILTQGMELLCIHAVSGGGR
jgi:thiamine biosynthesis protein ThiS